MRRKTGWSDVELAVTKLLLLHGVSLSLVYCAQHRSYLQTVIPWSGSIMGKVVVLTLVDWTVRGHRQYDPVDMHED